MRSETELLALVQAKAAAMRRRRRTRTVAAAGTVLTAMVVAGAVAVAGRDTDGREVVAADGGAAARDGHGDSSVRMTREQAESRTREQTAVFPRIDRLESKLTSWDEFTVANREQATTVSGDTQVWVVAVGGTYRARSAPAGISPPEFDWGFAVYDASTGDGLISGGGPGGEWPPWFDGLTDRSAPAEPTAPPSEIRPHGENCGTYSSTHEPPGPDVVAINECLLRAFEEQRPAYLRRQGGTAEGDPVAELLQAEADRRLLVEHDARQDRFGSGRIQVYQCGSVKVVEGALVYDACTEPTTPDGPRYRTCTAETLKGRLEHYEQAMNQPSISFSLTNRGDACTLIGYPAVQIVDGDGHLVHSVQRKGGGFIVDDPGPSDVTLPPDAKAWFVVSSFTICTGEPSEARTGAAVRVGLAGQKTSITIDASVPYCPGVPVGITALSAKDPLQRIE